MATELGKDFVAQIEVSSTLTTIACQEDMTVSSGKTLQRSRAKDKTTSFPVDEGLSATFTVQVQNPANATHSAILDAHDNDSVVNGALVSNNSGGLSYTGAFRWVWEEIGAPVDGVKTVRVTMSIEGNATRGTVSA